MAFQDQTLTCKDCGKQFTWTASEQEFYASKGFQNAPVRCPEDRAAKRARMDGGGGRGGGGGSRQMYEITCSVCGKKDMVPFQPRGDRPVYCSEHFKQQRDGGAPVRADETPKAEAEEPAEPAEAKEEEVAPAAEE